MQKKKQNKDKKDMTKVNELLARIKSDDAAVRTEAWLGAREAGPAALRPLARVAAEGSLEVSRAAHRAMWAIVHAVGAPDGKGKKQACKVLAKMLGDKQPVSVRREAIWMLSEISDGGEDVEAVAALLKSPELREDARCVLQRIPGEESLAALKAGFESSPEEFKFALADSLRRRGVKVEGYESQKLVPAKQTKVRPVGRT